MAQLNAPKAFDDQAIEPKVLDPIKPLVEHINQNFDQLIRALFQQLTLSENFKGRLATVSAYHNTPTALETGGIGVSGASVLKVDGDGISRFKFTAEQSGKLQLTFGFSEPVPIKTRSVSIVKDSATNSLPLAQYEVQASLAIRVGDSVSISGYGNKNNNGEFLVLGRTTNTITVYSASGAAETKADFTGISESPKLVTLFLYG